MQTSKNINKLLELNGQNSIRNYSAKVINTTLIHRKVQYSSIAMLFSMQYLGINELGNLNYNFIVNKRLFLDEKGRPIFKPSKAQKIALEVAKINDDLIIEITPNYGFLSIKNTDQIIKSWRNIKINILEAYPDLNIVVADFDWQMKEENIQNIYKSDNFYAAFFANFFKKELNNAVPIKQTKILANGLGNLDIPILETLYSAEQDSTTNSITLKIKAELDTENKKFPLAKMNIFLGQLPTKKGSNHNLDFTYNGHYNVNPKLGVITQGNIVYDFEIKDLYKKTTAINFELDTNE